VSEFIWQRALQNFQTQRFSEAISDCEQLIHASPVWPMAFPLLSSIYLHTGQIKLATYYAAAATRHLDQLNWQGILSISTALIMVGENRLAHDILLDIESRQFEPAKAYLHLGRQYSTLEDIPRALQSFESAFAAGDKTAFTHLMYGLNCAHLGKLDEASNAYEKALVLEPELAHAHWAKAQVASKENAGKHIEQMQTVFAGKSLNSSDQAYVDYALYKEYERLGEFDRAWAALTKGAQARRGIQLYDGEKERRTFESMASVFNADADSVFQKGQNQQTPIFIVGMPRTGTTLLERILGNHPEIIACGELAVMQQQLQWVLNQSFPLAMDEASAVALRACNFAELGQRYLQKTAWLVEDKKFFSDKNPMNFMFCGAILKALPGAKIIHMQRNPMDTCFSNYKEMFAEAYYPYSYALSDCAAHYRNYRQLMAAWHARWPGKILDVKYENLVADPVLESKRIFDYLGLKYSREVIEIENNKTITTTASSLQVRESIHAKNVQGWKTYAGHLSVLQEDLQDEIADYNVIAVR
jgi:tetratricopeptide (TPR) repeat protein